MILHVLFYTTLISIDLAQYEIFCVKVGVFWQFGILLPKETAIIYQKINRFALILSEVLPAFCPKKAMNSLTAMCREREDLSLSLFFVLLAFALCAVFIALCAAFIALCAVFIALCAAFIGGAQSNKGGAK